MLCFALERMAGVAGTCSCGLILNNKESSRNTGESFFQFAGLHAAEVTASESQRRKGVSLKSAPQSRKIRAMASPIASAPKREKDPKKRIVITGMGLVSVFGSDIDTFYSKLLEGESGISLIDRFDASDFPVKIAGQIRGFSSLGYIGEKNDRRLDDCWRYCLVAGKRALEDANLGQVVLRTMDRSRIGVLIGTGLGGITSFNNGVESLITKGYKEMSPFFIPYTITNMGSALLAIDTGLMGPNYTISTLCASANCCFFAAANHIRKGDADIMVAGGTEAALTPLAMGGFIVARSLSQRNDEPQKASRPWDQDRDGAVLTEGSGVLVMESLEHAVKRGANIIAEYLGGAINSDAHHIIYAPPDGLGGSLCMMKSLENAGVSPEEVNYVNAYASAVPVAENSELNAINKVFKDTSEIKMNSTKSIIGHGLGASGGIEAIATIKALKTGWLHPTINQNKLVPGVTIDTVPNVKKQHEVNVAISNSLGLGGHNAVAVFAPFKP